MTGSTPEMMGGQGGREAPWPFIVCISGPDAGKRAALADGTLHLGASAENEILSDDPEVSRRHAALAVRGGQVTVSAGDGAVFVDGRRLDGPAVLGPGQQLRVGRSLWRIEPRHDASLARFIRDLGDRISVAAGVEKIEGFSAREMFSEVFRKRSEEEIEDYFTVGTARTTPSLVQVSADWPRPWAFARTFLMASAAYALLYYGWQQFQNPYFLPGIIAIGSIAIPLAVLIFFFEMNVVRNISTPLLLKLMVFGGIFSLLVSLFFFRAAGALTWLGAMRAGIVEETGKLVVVLFFARKARFPWLLNGLLIGAAVGTGFSVFETAGYVLVHGLLGGGGTEGMFAMITYRGPLSVLADHSLWTGLVAAGLWRVRGQGAFRLEMLWDWRFLRVLVFAMALHMINNSPLELPANLKFWGIGFAAWVVLLGFIQEGLKEVRSAQVARITGGHGAAT